MSVSIKNGKGVQKKTIFISRSRIRKKTRHSNLLRIGRASGHVEVMVYQNNIIASGAFGKVYKGKGNGVYESVVVKVNDDSDEKSDFIEFFIQIVLFCGLRSLKLEINSLSKKHKVPTPFLPKIIFAVRDQQNKLNIMANVDLLLLVSSYKKNNLNDLLYLSSSQCSFLTHIRSRHVQSFFGECMSHFGSFFSKYFF